MNLYHTIPTVEKTGLVQAITSMRHGGVSQPPYHSLNLADSVDDHPEAVIANRCIFFDQIGLDIQNFVFCRQIHSDCVRLVNRVDTSSSLPLAEADAMITNQPSLALGVFTADCIPIFIVDIVTPAIGIVHAGWRGTLAGITTKTIKAMERHFATEPSNCLAHLGPSIQKCCYTVSSLLADKFQDTFGPEVRCGKGALSLQMANLLQLRQVGLPQAAISIAQLCTACRTDLFYSHRAEGGNTGRMLSLIRLSESPFTSPPATSSQ
jgi:YfiH family protein